MSKGKGRKGRRQARKSQGNQGAMGGGRYGNRSDLEQADDYLRDAMLGGELPPEGDPNRTIASTRPGPGLTRVEIDVPTDPRDEETYSVPRALRKLRDEVSQPASPRAAVPPAFRRAPAAFDRVPAKAGSPGFPDSTLNTRLEAISPGLAERLAQGLTQDELRRRGPEIAQALKDAGAAPGTYTFSEGNPAYGSKVIVLDEHGQPGPHEMLLVPEREGDTGRVRHVMGAAGEPGEIRPGEIQPGDIIAVQQPLGFADTGIELPADGGYPAGSKVWRVDDLTRLSDTVREMLDEGMSSEAIAEQVSVSAANQGLVLDDLETMAAQLRDRRIEDFQSTITAALDARAKGVHGDATLSLTGKPASPDSWFLPPALQGLPDDATVPVIISTRNEKPPGAAEFLGRLDHDMRTESGETWPAGAAVWRNAAPPSSEALTDRMILDEEDMRPVVRAGMQPLRTNWQAENILDRHAKLAARYRDQDAHTLAYLTHLLNASWEEDPDQAARMHWPVQAAGERGVTDARQMATLISRALREALTYQVTAPMVDTMRQAELLMPGVQKLNEGDLPAVAGFAWLDDPWVIPVVDGPLPVRAVSWEKITVPADRYLFTPGARSRSADAVRLVFWVHLPDVVAWGHFAVSDPRVKQLSDEIGDLIPHHVSVLPFGYGFVARGDREPESMAMLALIHSLWTFLGMELSASRTVRPSAKGHRRTVLRSIRHDRVHVITLRRVNYIYPASGPGGSRQFTRACKWWVEDFYRHIDSYKDEDENGRPRRHEAVPSGQLRDDPEPGEYDVCAVCQARGQSVRITLVHGHRRGPAYLPWKQPAKGRTVRRLSR